MLTSLYKNTIIIFIGIAEIVSIGKKEVSNMENKQRIIQELVPGKQITLAHIIANPDPILYEKLGLDPAVEYAKSAIGVLTVSPAETAIIMADIGIKSAGVELGFVDRFSGSVILTGTVSEVEASVQAILHYVETVLGYATVPISRT
jgi:ethanolamine utilization protein EutS